MSGLYIAIPCAELGYSRFWQALLTVPGFGEHVADGRVLTHSGSYIHATHNKLVAEALKDPRWDRLLFIEHDHEFTPDVLERHAAYTEPIVSGLYTLRDIEQPLPVVYRWDAERHALKYPDAPELNTMLTERGLYEVDVVPMGCTSIRRDVLEAWPADTAMFSSYATPEGGILSDDVWFCRHAQQQGWSVHIDTSLRVQHFAQVPIDDSYFVKWWNVNGHKKAVAEVGSRG